MFGEIPNCAKDRQGFCDMPRTGILRVVTSFSGGGGVEVSLVWSWARYPHPSKVGKVHLIPQVGKVLPSFRKRAVPKNAGCFETKLT